MNPDKQEALFCDLHKVLPQVEDANAALQVFLKYQFSELKKQLDEINQAITQTNKLKLQSLKEDGNLMQSYFMGSLRIEERMKDDIIAKIENLIKHIL